MLALGTNHTSMGASRFESPNISDAALSSPFASLSATHIPGMHPTWRSPAVQSLTGWVWLSLYKAGCFCVASL